MKTTLVFLLAALLPTTAAWSQSQMAAFEKASLATTATGHPCLLLNWKSGTEKTAYYLVESSTDGKTFRPLALVFTAEDPAFCDYTFRDERAAKSQSDIYYRIGLVSEQREVTYLPVKKASLAASGTTGPAPIAAKTGTK